MSLKFSGGFKPITSTIKIRDLITGPKLLWTLINPDINRTPASDQFGYAVDTDGVHTIIGSANDRSAIIYNVSTNAVVHSLSQLSSSWFGETVAIDGNYAVVSSYAETVNGFGGAGVAYVYDVTTGALLRIQCCY